MLLRWLVTFAAATAALHAQDRPAGRGVNYYSIEKEQALGADLARTFRQQHTPLDNATVRDYIEQMRVRLVRSLPGETPFTFHFEVTSDSTGSFLEPASFPGGYIFVPVGIILATNNEVELAGTMAHAIGHVLARHYSRQATRQKIQQLATIPLILWGGQAGFGAQQSTNVLPLGVLRVQRANESEADRMAVTNRDDRLRDIESAIHGLPAHTYTASGDFARIQSWPTDYHRRRSAARSFRPVCRRNKSRRC